MTWRVFTKTRAVAGAAVFIFAGLLAKAALAEVDVRTPWANVYVGPGGVYVYGPWGRVEVPQSDRERVCDQWRKSVLEHYAGRDCKVAFDDKGCTIEKVDCP
jgi:hypothetical protein